jgi:acetyl esterase/lipase
VAAIAPQTQSASAGKCDPSGQSPAYANVTYSTAPNGTPLQMDIFVPPGGAKHPGLLVIHGGSWRFGCKEDVWPEARAAMARGFTAYAVNYRLDCEGKGLCGYDAPAPVQDLQAAMTFIRANANTYKTDSAHVSTLGFSAGGHLSFRLAENGTVGGTRPNAIASLSGPATLRLECDKNGSSDPCAMRTYYIGCKLKSCASAWTAESPSSNVTAGTSPAFVANGTKDKLVLYQNAVDMTNALNAKGIANQLCTVDTGKHAQATDDLTCEGTPSQTVLQAAFDFLMAHD